MELTQPCPCGDGHEESFFAQRRETVGMLGRRGRRSFHRRRPARRSRGGGVFNLKGCPFFHDVGIGSSVRGGRTPARRRGWVAGSPLWGFHFSRSKRGKSVRRRKTYIVEQWVGHGPSLPIPTPRASRLLIPTPGGGDGVEGFGGGVWLAITLSLLHPLNRREKEVTREGGLRKGRGHRFKLRRVYLNQPRARIQSFSSLFCFQRSYFYSNFSYLINLCVQEIQSRLKKYRCKC